MPIWPGGSGILWAKSVAERKHIKEPNGALLEQSGFHREIVILYSSIIQAGFFSSGGKEGKADALIKMANQRRMVISCVRACHSQAATDFRTGLVVFFLQVQEI